VSKVVLDASAILAFLNEEPGAEKLTDELLAEASVSTVNVTEAATKLIQGGDDPGAVWRDLEFFFPSRKAFTVEHARTASRLVFADAGPGIVAGGSRVPGLGHCTEGSGVDVRPQLEEIEYRVTVHLMPLTGAGASAF